jgi:hypothetical protein
MNTEETKTHGVLEYMNHTGHTEVKWDKSKDIEVQGAKAQFDLLVSKGYAAFKLKSDGTQGEQIREFDPNAERILLTTARAGG